MYLSIYQIIYLQKEALAVNTSVFVISITGKRLMPTSSAKARKLLKAKKATVYQKRPFTIQLNYKSGATTQDTVLGIDTGSQHIGVAVVANDNVVYKAEIELRDTMKKRSLMETRKTYRRGRRYRKVRYRHPKFKFHTRRVYSEKLVTRKSTKHKTHWIKVTNTMNTNRHEGWLPPSIESKINHHFEWIDRYLDVLPANTKLHLEVARFDIARVKDPTIHGEMYQHGPMYEEENLRAFVFARDNYKCKCCGAKAGTTRKDGMIVKLCDHHIDLRSKGASNKPEDMASVCDACHTTRNHQPGGILYQWYKEHKKFARGYRDSTFMNILRKRMFAKYPDAVFTYGNITAADRKRLLLPKSHANDAVAIAAMTNEILHSSVDTIYFKQVRKKKRSLHEANPRKGNKEPNREAKRNTKNTKASHGFALWDKVRVCGKTGWISGFADKGLSAYIVDDTGNYIKRAGKNYKTHQLTQVKILQRNNNWLCFSKAPIHLPTL